MIGANAPAACVCGGQHIPQTLARRLLSTTGAASGWALPAMVLALLPKCPLCIATWLAVLGGAGISFAALSHLRIAILVLCWSVLFGMLTRSVARSVQGASQRKETAAKPAVISTGAKRSGEIYCSCPQRTNSG